MINMFDHMTLKKNKNNRLNYNSEIGTTRNHIELEL